jgi:multisubunit Na+/H+ antiporter MnhF subunit
VNAWLIAALVLTVGGLLPCLVRTLYGPPEYRLPGVALAATVTAVVFLLLAQGLTRSSYGDLALVLAVLSPAGTLVFTRLLAGERPGVERRRGT